MALISAWLAKKAVMIGVCVMALIGVFTLPASIYLDVKLNGLTVPLFGWHLIDGAIKERDDAVAAKVAALDDLKVCKANTATLQAGIGKQNTAIKAKAAADKAATDAANAALAAERAKNAALQDRLKNITGTKLDTSNCPGFALSLGDLINANAK